jgi:hypothetical protein
LACRVGSGEGGDVGKYKTRRRLEMMIYAQMTAGPLREVDTQIMAREQAASSEALFAFTEHKPKAMAVVDCGAVVIASRMVFWLLLGLPACLLVTIPG